MDMFAVFSLFGILIFLTSLGFYRRGVRDEKNKNKNER